MKSVFTITIIALLPIAAFAQTPPAPPQPPQPPHPPGMPGHHEPGMPGHREKGPKVPVTYLGVDTSQVPTVVSDQLGLAKGFGLVVDYVEPNSPAATAGRSTERHPQIAKRPNSDRAESVAKAAANFPRRNGSNAHCLAQRTGAKAYR